VVEALFSFILFIVLESFLLSVHENSWFLFYVKSVVKILSEVFAISTSRRPLVYYLVFIYQQRSHPKSRSHFLAAHRSFIARLNQCMGKSVRSL